MINQFDLNFDEKYRPKSIQDLAGQPHFKGILKNWVQIGKIPHMLLSGPPGVGKTSTATVIAHELFGKAWRYNFHEYNASDNRGIDFIRNEIKRLVSVVPVGASSQIIFLDEADELTASAQTALRQIMMKHTDTTKFILACNYPENIIDPIKDRMVVFNFELLQPEVIVEKLKFVCTKESIGFEGNALEIIAESSGGSLRKAIRNIEVYRNADNFITLDNIITLESTRKRISSLEIEGIESLIQKAFAGDIEEYEKKLDKLFDGGFRATEMLSTILDFISKDKKIEKPLKQALINQTGNYEWRIRQGSNESLQMRCYVNALSRTFLRYNNTS
jgi:replication factor C small subunit